MAGPAAAASALDQIVAVQQQQLLTFQQLVAQQSRPAVPDDRHAWLITARR